MRVLLITPPMVQFNTAYPAVPVLAGFLRDKGHEVAQEDLSLGLALRLFSPVGLSAVERALRGKFKGRRRPASVRHLLQHAPRIRATVADAVLFLQGRAPDLASQLAAPASLPEGSRFEALRGLVEGEAVDVVARHRASLFLDEIADAVREGLDDRFELARYGERLSTTGDFESLHRALSGRRSLVDRWIDEEAETVWRRHQPRVVGITVPFPGTLYGALRIARRMKALDPRLATVLGGGFVNTELRELSDPRVFDYVDFVTLDDGERPLLALIDHLRDPTAPLLRTFAREGDRVVWRTDPALHDIPLRDAGTPTYDGLPLDRYLSLFEMLNPMHRLWSDGRWNKLTIAHGCYWKKCTFCDVTLDYIGRYDLASADLLVDRIEAIVAETGQSGFHFVDEAAPPAGLRALAKRLIARNVVITWWGNIRFEKSFTPELTELLARSGCIAISGGLEVASDRLLELIKKGVTVEQVARVTRAFTQAGIMVHAYLMYGFPTETTQETIDSLERVRQLFAAECLQSAFWHRFAATAHSPIGRHPDRFGIRLHALPAGAPFRFARNDLAFDDPTGTDHDALGVGLRRALYNYMLGLGLDHDVRRWFSTNEPRVPDDRARGGRRGKRTVHVPATTVPPHFIARALRQS